MFSIFTIGNKVKSILFLLIVMSIPTTALADLIFSAPPREDAERGKEIYEPIAERLSEIIGKKVVYEHPHGWQEYGKKMRDGYYDIVFDGPHFTAWRMKHLSHIPIVTLPGKLDFYLVAWKNDAEIKSPRDLVGQKICGMTSPHLATDMIYDLYKNPVLQPQIYDVKGRMRDVYEAFKDGKCRATIFRDTVFNKLPAAEKNKLKIVVKTRSLPNQAISISDRLKNNAKKLAEFFKSREGAMISNGILQRYSKKQKYFQSATVAEFNGVESILENVVWGW